MSEHLVIACPNAACAKPLRLSRAALDRPLSCPHCHTGIAASVADDGSVNVRAVPSARRVPGMFLVPGFALLILGAAGACVNGYVAFDAASRPGADAEHAGRLVSGLRDAGTLGGNQKAIDATPQEQVAAVIGTAAMAAAQDRDDAAHMAAWAPRVAGVHALFAAVSLVMAAGGFAILRGKWYWLAVVGCVAALLNLNYACCMVGGIAGVWGLLTLVRDDGRKHFGK